MRTLLSLVFAVTIAVVVVASPIAYKRCHDRDYRNFRVVEPGILYRSGQLPPQRLQQVIAANHIRTIVCLREGDKSEDQKEETWANYQRLKFVRIPPRSWQIDATGKVPAEASLKTFREVMDHPANYPVLVHCFAGIHRTGTMCAVFRMDYQGWTNDQAMAEMRVNGYTLLDDHEDIHHYLMSYHSPSRTPAKSLSIVPVARQIPAHP